jgi:hypothetical protein
MSKKSAVSAKPSAAPPPAVCKESMIPPSKTKVVSAAAGSADKPLIEKQTLYTPKARSVQHYKDHCPECNSKDISSVENDRACEKCKIQWHPCIKAKRLIADKIGADIECPFCPDDDADLDKYC